MIIKISFNAKNTKEKNYEAIINKEIKIMER